jgi:deoxyadenosine/deoxycytidine kinase
VRFYVNVTGNLAAGCTTIAIRLGEAHGWHVILERDVESPFLKKFYDEPKRWAFHNQVYFIMQSLEQHLILSSDVTLANATVVQDYTIFDPLDVYARSMAELGALSADELEVLERLFRLFKGLVRAPDLLVYLKAPLEVIWSRVRKRARPTERAVDIRYLEVLQECYDRFIRSWTKSPIIVVDTGSVDFTVDDAALRRLGDEIRGHLPALAHGDHEN